MELLGRINRRKIYYVQVRNNPEWKSKLPNNDWVAFTIANKEYEEMAPVVVNTCIDNNISYACCAGNLASRAEVYFDEELSWRSIDNEVQRKEKSDDKNSLMTTAHRNLAEGFWFASVVANDNNFDIDKVVCIDMTKLKVRNELLDLIGKINNGWLPEDKVF